MPVARTIVFQVGRGVNATCSPPRGGRERAAQSGAPLKKSLPHFIAMARDLWRVTAMDMVVLIEILGRPCDEDIQRQECTGCPPGAVRQDLLHRPVVSGRSLPRTRLRFAQAEGVRVSTAEAVGAEAMYQRRYLRGLVGTVPGRACRGSGSRPGAGRMEASDVGCVPDTDVEGVSIPTHYDRVPPRRNPRADGGSRCTWTVRSSA